MNQPEKQKKPIRKKTKVLLCVLGALLLVIVAAGAYGVHWYIHRNDVVRVWSVETGAEMFTDDAHAYTGSAYAGEASIQILQIQPKEVAEEGFTYYSDDVQARAQAIVDMLKDGQYTFRGPLAIMNPYGTGATGLYLYFTTRAARAVSYTVSSENSADFTREVYEGEEKYLKEHEFQIIGLVPSQKNTVTLKLTAENGNVQTVTYTLDAPAPRSGYDTRWTYTDGESKEALSDGLYYTLGTAGNLGYCFLFDNDGVMRYEICAEGTQTARILTYKGDIVFAANKDKIARMNRLGKLTGIYTMPEGKYAFHHDLNDSGTEGKIYVLADNLSEELIEGKDDLKRSQMPEDLVLELDLETGEYTVLLDFMEIMNEYWQMTRLTTLTDTMPGNVGKDDWLHFNSVYAIGDDSLVLSAREPSTIIKMSNVHSDSPVIDYFIADERIWTGTKYEEKLLTMVGEFSPQYGQHDVRPIFDDSLPDGQYYLMLYNNNYWAVSTRDYDNMDTFFSDTTGTGLLAQMMTASDKASMSYTYLVDENARTYELVRSIETPYSGIVSSSEPHGDHVLVNGGISKTLGEYDGNDVLIRQYDVPSTMLTYRTFKGEFMGYWFR